MNAKIPLLLFDFDGVLMDSRDEAILTGYNTVTGELLTSPAELPPKLFSLLRRNRYVVMPAGDFVVFTRWGISQVDRDPEALLTHEQFEELVANEREPLHERTIRFFKTRERLVARDRERWLALHQPMQPIWDTLRARVISPIILTNKNRQAVLDLGQHFGLTFDPEQIYSGDDGATKDSNLRQIAARFPTPPLFFVDDSIGNLLALQKKQFPFPLRFGLATWGYLGPDDLSRAAQAEFACLTQSSLIELLPP